MNLVVRLQELGDQVRGLEQRLDQLNLHSAENAVRLYEGIMGHLACTRSEMDSARDCAQEAAMDMDKTQQQIEADRAADRQQLRELRQHMVKLAIRITALARDVRALRATGSKAQALLDAVAKQDWNPGQLALAQKVAALAERVDRGGLWRRLWRWLYNRRGN